MLRCFAFVLACLAASAGAKTLPLATVTASDGAADDLFGYDLAVDGDWAVVGAFGDDSASNDLAGAAYVFERTAQGWVERAKLVPPSAPDGGFGTSVALDGDRIIVGQPRNLYDPGVAYVYRLVGSVWELEAELVGDRPDQNGPQDGDFFGADIAIDEGRALIGAFLEGTGAAYVFRRDASGCVQ